MSAIASFTLISKARLDGLRDAATPKKRFFGAPKDTYHDYIRQYGREVSDYGWSGYVLATLLPYLDKQGIKLMQSSEDELATHLCKAREATVFIFTPAHKAAYYDRLSPSLFSSDELRDYFNQFNATNEAEIGQAMLDGISSIQQSLAALDTESVILFSIG